MRPGETTTTASNTTGVCPRLPGLLHISVIPTKQPLLQTLITLHQPPVHGFQLLITFFQLPIIFLERLFIPFYQTHVYSKLPPVLLVLVLRAAQLILQSRDKRTIGLPKQNTVQLVLSASIEAAGLPVLERREIQVTTGQQATQRT